MSVGEYMAVPMAQAVATEVSCAANGCELNYGAKGKHHRQDGPRHLAQVLVPIQQDKRRTKVTLVPWSTSMTLEQL